MKLKKLKNLVSEDLVNKKKNMNVTTTNKPFQIYNNKKYASSKNMHYFASPLSLGGKICD